MLYVKKGNFINRKTVEERAKEFAAQREREGKPPDTRLSPHPCNKLPEPPSGKPDLYTYGANDPVSNIDPTGLRWTKATFRESAVKRDIIGQFAEQAGGKSMASTGEVSKVSANKRKATRNPAEREAKRARANSPGFGYEDHLRAESENIRPDFNSKHRPPNFTVNPSPTEHFNSEDDYKNFQKRGAYWHATEGKVDPEIPQQYIDTVHGLVNSSSQENLRKRKPDRTAAGARSQVAPEIRGRGEKYGSLVDLYAWMDDLERQMSSGAGIDVDEFIEETDKLLYGLVQADTYLHQRGNSLFDDVISIAQQAEMDLDYNVLTDTRYPELRDKILREINKLYRGGRLTPVQKQRLEAQLKSIDEQFSRRYQMR